MPPKARRRRAPSPRRSSSASELRARLAEAEQTIEAIRDGSVDALVVSTAEGDQIYALRTADRSYRHMIESVHEGAATLTDDGTVFYANRYLAELLEAPLERVISSSFGSWLAEPEVFAAWLASFGPAGGHLETRLRNARGRSVPVYLALSRLEHGEGPGLVLVVTDLRAQKRHEAVLASEELSRSILEQAADAVVVCDERGFVQQASESAKRLCPAGVLHRPFEDAFGVPLPPLPVHVMEAELGCGRPVPATVLMSARPLRGPQGVSGVVVTLTDISERKRAEQAIQQLHLAERQAREDAEAASRAKDEFLAMLAHELRNPLFALRNAVEVSRAGDDGRERALDIAARQVQQLARLIDDLFDMARVQRGRVELRREPLDLVQVVDRAVEITRLAVERRGHVLEIEIDEGLEVDADPDRLEQILVNLLSNAVKFTEPGGRIALTARREGSEAVVTVKDNGVGIEPELLSHVFELFAQGRMGLDRSAGGLGIGLTVTKRLVELHGGSVEARSEGPGQGAEFEIRLPVAERRTARRGRTRAAAERSDDSRRVLVVEDNPDAAESLAMLLRMLGHQVRTVHDAHAALDAVKADPPDIALVDIGLPGMDGYELALRLRELEIGTKTFLVALTGYGLAQDKRRAAEAGFHAHVVKPIALEELKRVLNQRN